MRTFFSCSCIYGGGIRWKRWNTLAAMLASNSCRERDGQNDSQGEKIIGLQPLPTGPQLRLCAPAKKRVGLSRTTTYSKTLSAPILVPCPSQSSPSSPPKRTGQIEVSIPCYRLPQEVLVAILHDLFPLLEIEDLVSGSRNRLFNIVVINNMR